MCVHVHGLLSQSVTLTCYELVTIVLQQSGPVGMSIREAHSGVETENPSNHVGFYGYYTKVKYMVFTPINGHVQWLAV